MNIESLNLQEKEIKSVMNDREKIPMFGLNLIVKNNHNNNSVYLKQRN